MMSRSRLNQNSESCVSTRPLSGIGVGKTTSNAERRSVAMSSNWPPTSYRSRTFPRFRKWIPGRFVSHTTVFNFGEAKWRLSFREADILAYGPAMSTEKKNEKWKTDLREGNESGVQSFSLPMRTSCARGALHFTG